MKRLLKQITTGINVFNNQLFIKIKLSLVENEDNVPKAKNVGWTYGPETFSSSANDLKWSEDKTHNYTEKNTSIYFMLLIKCVY